jgi:XTP/dITP diphosphohydrolase
MDCFSDDTGLEVEALDNAPGVFSARYAGPEQNPQANVDKLLREMEGKENRKAGFRTVVALILGTEEYLFEGEVRGRIIKERRGGLGFGYDPVFMPEGHEQTFAELSSYMKNAISHRAVAMRKLSRFLSSLKK